MPLPAVSLSLRGGDLSATSGRIDELARHLKKSSDHLAAARAVLEAKRELIDLAADSPCSRPYFTRRSFSRTFSASFGLTTRRMK